MKQRLLLALLMLLTSAGFMKVDGQTIVLPKSDTGEKVTLTFTGKFSATAYPVVYGNVNAPGNVVKIVGTPGATAVYELVSSVKQDTTYVLNNAYLADWGEIGVTLDGKVLKFEASGNSNVISPKFSSLEFLNNDTLVSLNLEQASGLKILDISGNDDLTSITNLGGAINLETLYASGCGFTSLDLTTSLSKLKTLDLSDNKITSLGNLPTSIESLDISNNGYAGANGSWDLSSYTNLKTLDIDGNKLQNVAVTDELLKSDYFNKGTQDFTYLGEAFFVNQKANVNLDITTAKSIINLGTDKFVSAESWKKYNDKTQKYDIDATGEANTTVANNKTLYRFFDSNKVYVSGKYECVLVSENGFKYRVRFNVDPAIVTLTRKVGLETSNTAYIRVENSNQQEVFSTYNTNQVSVNQGEVLKVAVELSSTPGYTLDKFILTGLELMDNSTLTQNGITCKVAAKYNSLGDELPSIDATLKGVDCVVKYNTPDPTKGFMEVFKQDADNNYTLKVKSEDKLAYGTKIRIVLTPKDLAASLTLNINGKTYSSDDLQEMPQKGQFYLDYEVKGETVLSSSFDKAAVVAVGALLNGKSLNDSNPYISGLSVTIAGPGVSSANNTLSSATTAIPLLPGSEYQLTTQITRSSGYVIDQILLNGAPVNGLTSTVENGCDVYRASFTCPSAAADLCLIASKAEAVEVIPTNVENNVQTVVYDGTVQTFKFKTNPEGLESLFDVSYQLEGNSNWLTDPTTAGTYKVQLKQKKENKYKVSPIPNYSLVIKKAKPTFAQVPTVSIVDDNYQITGTNVDGVIGHYEVVRPSSVNTTSSHVVTFKFIPDETANYEEVEFVQGVEVAGSTKLAKQPVSYQAETGLTVQMLASEAAGSFSSGSKFVEGTELTFLVSYPQGVRGSDIKATKKTDNSSINGSLYSTGVYAFKYTTEDTNDGEEIIFTIAEASKLTQDYVISLDKTLYQKEYTATPLSLDDFGATLTVTPNQDPILSFKDVAGNKLSGYPVNVGKYTLCVYVPASNGYKALTKEFTNVFEIKKATPIITSWPTARPISNGQTLEFASLEGGASTMVAGFFEFVDKSIKPKDGDKCAVRFVPFDETNYETVETKQTPTDQRVVVTVIDQPLLTIATPKYGSVKVVDANTGAEYHSGDPVAEGSKLTISATAYDHFKFSKFVVNGTSLTNNPASYTVGNSVVEVSAEFSYIEEEPEIDENSRYTVNVTKVLRGAVIDKPGANSVKRGESFSFSVTTLAADASKVVVKVDGETIKPVSGKYTITNITENKEVSVTLSNPTEIKLTIPTEYKNEGGYLMGSVKISGPSDGKYYYNDQITLVAFPESGVKFAGWTGDVTGLTQIKEVVLTKNLTVKATFTGTPTGIEDIMAASITTGRGYVWVRGIANADVTIVSISGRVQARQRISGDTQINVPAGIYVVVLESGSDVKRAKVIVK